MTSKKVLVTLEKKTVKVTCSTFNSLLNGTKSKFNLSTDAFHLEYFDDSSNKWITLCDDEDMEDVSTNTEVRIILKEADAGAATGVSYNMAFEGAAAYESNALVVGGKFSRTVAAGNIGGDAMVGKNVVKVGKQIRNVNVKDQTSNVKNQINNSSFQGGGFDQRIAPAYPTTDDSDDDKKKH